MLNLHKQHILLIHEIIRMIKTYGEYLPRKESNKSNTYILQDEYDSYNWSNVKMDPVKTEVNTKNVKYAEISLVVDY